MLPSKSDLRYFFDYRHDGLLIWKNPPTNRTKIGSTAGSVNRNGYCQIGVGGRIYLAHRLIFMWHFGEVPKELDHINRNRSDNRIENLRDSCGFNNANRTKLGARTSKYRGVSWSDYHKKWQVACKEKFVGRFRSERDAARAYNIRAYELFGVHAHLNPV